MAHTLSRRRKATYARGSPIAIYRGFDIVCTCGPCRATREIAADDVIEQLGPAGAGASVGEIVQRLRCRSCGALPAAVVLVKGELLRLPVWGPEVA